jgi:hypothetical protein
MLYVSMSEEYEDDEAGFSRRRKSAELSYVFCVAASGVCDDTTRMFLGNRCFIREDHTSPKNDLNQWLYIAGVAF